MARQGFVRQACQRKFGTAWRGPVDHGRLGVAGCGGAGSVMFWLGEAGWAGWCTFGYGKV